MKWTNSKQFKRTEQKPCLAVGDEVVFVVGGEKYLGAVIEGCGDYHIRIIGKWNCLVFELLGIEKPLEYVKAIQGYANGGLWPYSKTLQDLTRVAKAVLKDCEKHNAKLEEEQEAGPIKGSLENPWDSSSIHTPMSMPIGDYYQFMGGEIVQRIK